VSDFQKHLHVVSADRVACEKLAPHVIALAEAEGLPAHADSMRYRLNEA
jgi:histidinol dehydrogenase